MAGVPLSVNFDDVTLTVGSWKTVAAVKAASNHPVKIRAAKAAGAGVAGDAEPIGFRFVRLTAASGTGTATTPIKLNDSGVTVQTTARVNFSVEPSESGSSPYIGMDKFHPQGGIVQNYEFQDFLIDGGAETGVQMKVPTGGTGIKVSGHLLIEE